MHVGCINESDSQNRILGYLKYMVMFVNMATRLRISLNDLPTDRRIGLLRHAYQQQVGLR